MLHVKAMPVRGRDCMTEMRLDPHEGETQLIPPPPCVKSLLSQPYILHVILTGNCQDYSPLFSVY